jgi:hypothetical protein
LSSCSIFESVQSTLPFSTATPQCVQSPMSLIASGAPQFGQRRGFYGTVSFDF